MTKTVVKIEQVRSEGTKKGKRETLGIHHLPEEIKESYPTKIYPCYIDFIGKSAKPWLNPGVDIIQSIFDKVYSQYSCELKKSDAACATVCFHHLNFGFLK
jgi:hypothetical protein